MVAISWHTPKSSNNGHYKALLLRGSAYTEFDDDARVAPKTLGEVATEALGGGLTIFMAVQNKGVAPVYTARISAQLEADAAKHCANMAPGAQALHTNARAQRQSDLNSGAGTSFNPPRSPPKPATTAVPAPGPPSPAASAMVPSGVPNMAAPPPAKLVVRAPAPVTRPTPLWTALRAPRRMTSAATDAQKFEGAQTTVKASHTPYVPSPSKHAPTGVWALGNPPAQTRLAQPPLVDGATAATGAAQSPATGPQADGGVTADTAQEGDEPWIVVRHKKKLDRPMTKKGRNVPAREEVPTPAAVKKAAKQLKAAAKKNAKMKAAAEKAVLSSASGVIARVVVVPVVFAIFSPALVCSNCTNPTFSCYSW